MKRLLLVLAPALLCSTVVLACRKPAANTTGGAKASAAAPSNSHAALPDALLRAELQRDRNAVSEEDLGAESSRRRLVAVRALARIQDELSFEPLAKALADEDPAVVRWAAFGVGQLCRGREPEAVRRLVVRAASLAASPSNAAEHDEALGSLALALGRCASEEAEKTLRAWLRQPKLAASAALGLGRVARERKRLDDASIAALLDAAEQNPSEGAFFFPIESLPSLGAAARERLLEVAGKALEQPSTARAFAARALAKGGPDAAPALRRLIEAPGTNDVEGANAAAALAALGSAAQPELAATLATRAQRYLESDVFWSSDIGVLLVLLDGLEPKTGDSTLLTRLAQLPLAKDAHEPLLRRKVMVRCRAAAALAGSASLNAALLACDPAPPENRREGSLALLRVLARGSLAKGRGVRFQELARSPDRVVREAALELLVSHDEVADIPGLLASALEAKEVGVRATAARVLSRYPARANAGAAPVADPRVVQALSKQLPEVGVSNHIELSSLLLDAAAALELLGAKPALERACGSANPTLRQHAERGFAALGEPKRRCPAVPGKEALPTASKGEFALELETEQRTLRFTLSGGESPFATERLVQLARAGFYNGLKVHRVVPGFVVQIGDADGDGFGGPDLPPLRDQVTLEPFDVGSVGIALAGRDTGLSQFFVTLRRAPHLDGEYSLIGHAEPGWSELVAGDLIREVTVRDLSIAK
jgi:cyclophilin family peptidyl-prolyl cis-trans isomerase